ncbi:MAG TPA: thiamine pyrophosphate-binding protein [Burkholderiaceae bacterium]|nr:thiamine pyrophosphate-binding protein [Burkholderiaceae bacterium]
MKLADATVEALLALDVRFVFGVSGANIEHLHDAIHRRGGEQLISVMSKSESGAAFMADGYARVHRRLGVCCSTSGGGMLNLAVGIAESYAESVPVLAFVGQPPERGDGRGAFQDSSGIGRAVDAMTFFGGIAKFVGRIARAADFWPALERAVVAALSGRPGPAVLLVPRSSWAMDVALPPQDFARTIRSAARPPGIDALRRAPPRIGANELALQVGFPGDPEAAREALGAMLDALRKARAPVLVVGQGVRRCSNPAAVIDFARALQLPMVTDMSARGEVPNDDRLYLGMLGVAGHPSAHAYLRDQADLLLVVGSGLNAMTRGPLVEDPVEISAKKILAVNIDMGELRRALEPPFSLERSWWPGAAQGLLVGVEADAGVVFEELLRLWQASPFVVDGMGRHRLTTFRPLLAPEPAPPVAGALDGTLRQSEALDLLQRILPRGGHIVYDAGNCAAAALHQLHVPPGTSATIALGMGGMGYAIAAATGIALGSSADQRTIVLAGDGALLMAGFEIHTAVEMKLPILFVIFNNGMHGMCVTRQQTFFEGRLECVRYAPVDVATVARGIADSDRLWVARARTRDELIAALRDHLVHPLRPGVLELVLARQEVPPFTPLLPKDRTSLERPIDWEWD